MKSNLLLSLIAMTLGGPVLAGDINFITPQDLPQVALRSFSISGRGTRPQFPAGYGIDQAMKDGSEKQCMAPVGRQLTEWKTETSEETRYWSYSISAQFECLAPTESTVIVGQAAKKLYNDMKIESVFNQKNAQILCYSDLDEVCVNQTLMHYKERTICELTNLFDGSSVRLDDIFENDSELQNQGANALTADLPVYIDGRRDDSPGANCGGHVYGKLKGLSRQAATIDCTENGNKDVYCHVHGLIRPN